MITEFNPLVSVVIPVYNGANFLARAINSALQQTYQNIEIIVINDGSSDDSWQRIKKFRDARITVLNQKNKGLAKTLNYGISIANGALIARQDQDDLSQPTRIEMQVEKFKQNKNLGVSDNFYFVFRKSRYKFFIWLSGDDYISKDYLENNINTLLTNNNCVFAASPIAYVDENNDLFDFSDLTKFPLINLSIRDNTYISFLEEDKSTFNSSSSF